jgi:hexokinase
VSALARWLSSGLRFLLIDYLADCVDAFLTDYSGEPSDNEDLKLGLTFSFPVEQTALDRGKILTWTKGFAVRNAIGHDVVQLLQDAFDRKQLHVKCVALVNDVR